MPWVYVRPEGHKVPGVLSIRCPVCGRVGPAKEMARRMQNATRQPGVIAMLQRPSGRGRMSKATRLTLDQLRQVARLGDVRALAAVAALHAAIFGLSWLDVFRGPPPAELQHWAATTVPRPVTGAIEVRASVAPDVQRVASPIGTARSVGTVQLRAKVV
jgi:hypothetical protein